MTKIAKSPAAGGRANHHSTRRRGHVLLRSAAALLALGTLAAPASARPFQQYLNGACSGTLCKINFVKIPAGQRLIVSNASCYIRLGRDSGGFAPDMRAAQFLVLGVNPNTVVSASTVVPETVGRSDNEFVYAANHAVSFFAGPQQRIQAYVELFRGSFSQVACHISGDLVKAT